MSYDAIKKDLKSGEFARVYLFYGEEEYLKRSYGKQLRDRTVGETDSLDYHVFTGKNPDVAAIYDAVASYPVMSDKKLVVVEDYNPDEGKEETWKDIQAVIPDVPEDTVLVFTLQGEPGAGKGRMAALAKLVSKHGAVCLFKAAEKDDLTAWARRHFAALGRTADPAAVSRLLSVCDNAMDNLYNEIQKICAYAEGPKVRAEDVDAVATPSLDAKLYSLSDKLASRDYDGCLTLTDELLGQKAEVMAIASTLYRTVIQLHRIKLCGPSAQERNALCKTMGMRDFVFNKYAHATERMTKAFLRRALSACLDADDALKSSRADKRIVLECLYGRLLGLERKYG